jgi:hypothetical protein
MHKIAERQQNEIRSVFGQVFHVAGQSVVIEDSEPSQTVTV